MRVMRLEGTSYEAIADWLIDERVPTGPYATKRRWTGKLVEALLRDPILSGRRQIRVEASRLEYGSGKHKRKDNPRPPERKDWPELAYFTVAEHEELLAIMDAAEPARLGHPAGRESPLYNVPRACTLWPGQSIRCGVCGGWFYRYGAVMKCQNARGKGPKECWNRVQVRVDQVHQKVLALVLAFLDQHPGARGVIAQAAWRECQRLRGRQNRSLAGLDNSITALETEAKNLAKAIAKGGQLDALVSELTSVQERLAAARAERARQASVGDGVAAYQSVEELEAGLDRAVHWLAGALRDFADILRRLIPSFVIVAVQGVTGGQVRPRTKVVLSAAAWAAGGQQAPEVSATVDLFDPPDYIRFLKECVEQKRRDPRGSLTTLGARLRLNHLQVKRALDYHAAMLAAGTPEPYMELTGPPPAASRWSGQ